MYKVNWVVSDAVETKQYCYSSIQSIYTWSWNCKNLLPVCVYEYYFTVLTCDVETGPNDEAKMEKNTQEDDDEENKGL